MINSASTVFSLSNPAGDTVGVYVQGRSQTICSINASPIYGAPIAEYRLTIGGKTYSVLAGDVAVNPFTITTDVLTATGALTDKYTTAPEALADLSSKKIYFDLHSSGEGVAIGRAAVTASLFDVGLESKFRAAATFDGAASFGGVANFSVAPTFSNPADMRANMGITLAALEIKVGTVVFTATAR